MLNQQTILATLTGLGILLSLGSNVSAVQMPVNNLTTQFRRIEQPLGLKTIVTLGGLGLIGLELWWFLFSQHKIGQAKSIKGIQEISITVDGGYDPALIVVKAGQLVQLNFLRCDPNSCLEKVLFPDFHIAQDLPLNEVTIVEFTPEKPGKYLFTCGMNMFRGELDVR